LPEEDGHKGILSIVVRCTLLHERSNLIQTKHAIKIFVDLEYCFKLLLKRIRIAVVDLAFPSITLSNGNVGIRPKVVFANDKSKVLVSGGN
ncbi:hypothetical protein AnigIFM50267_005306, partial [Aspergillus niger]